MQVIGKAIKDNQRTPFHLNHPVLYYKGTMNLMYYVRCIYKNVRYRNDIQGQVKHDVMFKSRHKTDDLTSGSGIY